jgi:phosphoglycerate dehydrogenase-like enzyme
MAVSVERWLSGRSPFGMKIVAVRRNPQSSASDELAEVYGPECMDTLLRSADYMVIALPATPATIGAIGERQVSGMKPTAFLINIGRAEIVDQDALYHALSEHRIAGAALDVWYRYPAGVGPSLPALRPFHELPNVLMTPHIAGATHGTLEARAELIAENVRRIALNEPPLNLVSA